MIGFPPRTPFLISFEHREVPRSAERGQGRCPCTLPPLKRRAKLSNARVARRSLTTEPSPETYHIAHTKRRTRVAAKVIRCKVES